MSSDLDDLVASFDQLSQKAEEEADEKVRGKIAGLTRMTEREVKELFPVREDQKRLVELMQIVRSSDEQNKKINNIIDRSEEFSGIIVKLLNRFV